MYGLTKLAASFDARRNKQYWQLLKRLYGGGDEAIKAIQASGDPGIYHGTKEWNLKNIQKNGLKQGTRNLHGEGVYLGDREKAKNYGYSVLSTKKSLVRLKYPSELQETKILYPNPSFVKSSDLEEGGSIGGIVFEGLSEKDNPNYKQLKQRFETYGKVPAGKQEIDVVGNQMVVKGNGVSPDVLIIAEKPLSSWIRFPLFGTGALGAGMAIGKGINRIQARKTETQEHEKAAETMNYGLTKLAELEIIQGGYHSSCSG